MEKKEIKHLLTEQDQMRTDIQTVQKNIKSMLGIIYIILACLAVVACILAK